MNLSDLDYDRQRGKACADCKHCFVMGVRPMRWCQAPQLAEHLDGPTDARNTMTRCDGARDFKSACGHDARWFVQKESA